MVGRALQTGMQPIDPERFVAEYRKAPKLAGEHGTDLKYSGARLHTRTNTFCKAVTGSAFAVTPKRVNLSSIRKRYSNCVHFLLKTKRTAEIAFVNGTVPVIAPPNWPCWGMRGIRARIPAVTLTAS
jgi:hypothetical protein